MEVQTENNQERFYEFWEISENMVWQKPRSKAIFDLSQTNSIWSKIQNERNFIPFQFIGELWKSILRPFEREPKTDDVERMFSCTEGMLGALQAVCHLSAVR